MQSVRTSRYTSVPTGRTRGRGGAMRSVRGTRSAVSPPSAAFGQTLQFITSIKLQELEKQRVAYEAHSLVLQRASLQTNLVLKAGMLLDAVRSWNGSGSLTVNGLEGSTVGATLELHNLDTWLAQAQKDPSFSEDVLKRWINTLEMHMKHSLSRFECAKLFGKLFNEWLASGDSATVVSLLEAPPIASITAAVDPEAFVQMGRKEMYEQKEHLRSIIFTPKSIDTNALSSYLDELFVSDECQKVINEARDSIRTFGEELLRSSITAARVSWTVANLLASELMDETKRNTLREFTENPVVLEEVASVLNMRLASLSTSTGWTWPQEPITVEMRRSLNGKYRAYTNPDILDALFLQYVGVMWQCHFKGVIKTIVGEEAWKKEQIMISKTEIERRNQMLGEDRHSPGIQSQREADRNASFLVGQLPNSVHSRPTYEDVDADSEQNDESITVVKQKLLHIMTTESYLNNSLYGNHTIVCSDIEWFGPALSHDLILTILAFFGMPKIWVGFIKSFLRAPLRFADDPSEEIQIRECGTPISYALSALCGEVVLFVMDFAVNQRADGLFLYRMHDDLWLWDSNSDKCVAAWKEMNRYASIAGLKFNASKTGSVSTEKEVHPALPSGDVRWGFLKFNTSIGRFTIDQEEVSRHIIELRRQLSATKSIFGWVNAYNKYMAFFARNFGGKPAKCLGREHVNDVIDTLARIQQDLFSSFDEKSSEAAGGAVGHLRSMIKERFGVDIELPQGYFYFPISVGGLELRNALVEPFATRDSIFSKPEARFLSAMREDQMNYIRLKEMWVDTPRSTYDSRPYYNPEFMSFVEYASQRETRLASWSDIYQEMKAVVEPQHVVRTPSIEAAMKGAWGAEHNRWAEMNFYDKWIMSVYAEEIVARFGSLEIVDPALIPVGMVQLFRSSRMKWEQ